MADGGSDVALIELSATPPAAWGVEYAGWDASSANHTSAVGIHHPSGDVKKICFEDDAPYTDVTGGAQVWWIDAWELGVTEPGSSGSPLFNQDHRIIGSSRWSRSLLGQCQQWSLRLLWPFRRQLGIGGKRVLGPNWFWYVGVGRVSDRIQPG